MSLCVSDGIARSCTNDSLTDVQCKNFTPSLVSSGYGSQAVSMLTLSSEDSLSIKSIEDNVESNKDSRGDQKSSMEQTSSDSDNEENKVASNRLSTGSDLEEVQIQKEAVSLNSNNSDQVTENKAPESEELNKSNVDSNCSLDTSGSSVEARDGSLIEKPDPNNSNIHSTSCDTSLSETSEDVEKSNNTSESPGISQSERLKRSKEERKKIVESLGAISKDTGSNKTKRNNGKSGKPPCESQGPSAINEFVDPYSETAMEELERLGFEEDNESSEESSEKSPTLRTEELQIVETPERPRQGRKGQGQPRPQSCILSPSHDMMSIVEESMKRNSLTLQLSEDEMSGTVNI